MTRFDWRREFDWRLQKLLTYSAPVIKRPVGNFDAVEKQFSPVQSARYRELAERYSLSAWGRVCADEEVFLNVYFLDLFDRLVPRPPLSGRGLDIGAGGWSYLPALCAWSGIPWDGVELDAHRRYWTLATRRGHAEYMLRISAGSRYLPGSLLDLAGAYVCMTWFLPFVTPGPLRAARLPDRFFQPNALLRHAASLLSPGGVLFLLNQGEEEAGAQRRLFREEGLTATALGEVTSVFSPFRKNRFGWLWVKS
ncbi:MAG: hypothetical protein EPO39_01445 [Candidatus Manganitrophaceae bacterium]|nr:MAG: hypothetical protein EPO39_01445 [Candidatus Manganitrophaceae bacterium]